MRSSSVVKTAPTPNSRQAVAYLIRLLRLVRPFWGGIARGFCLGLTVGLVGLTAPYLSKLYFDNVYPARDVPLMHVLVIGTATIGIVTSLLSSLRSYYSQVIAARLGSAVGLMYFNHLQHLPLQFFEEHRTGEILSRLGDMRVALGTVSQIFQTILVNGVYLLLVPPFMILLNWKLSLVALITTPVTVLIATGSSRIVRQYMKLRAETAAELSAIQFEVLSQMRTLKTLSAEHKVFRDASQQTTDSLAAQVKSSGVGALVGLINSITRTLGAALFSWYAWTLILSGELSLGGFVAFSAYLAYLTGPVGALAGLFSDFQQLAVTLGRAFEYLDVEPEQDPVLAYRSPPPIRVPLQGLIELQSVSFGYSPGRDVLHNVSLEFPIGVSTAIVGSSGAGKSSVLRLLCRMSDPSAGRISIDGRPISQIPMTELRSQVAVVWQEPMLFRGTIWENLTFGLEGVSRDRVEDAIGACCLRPLIDELPHGYDTPVAEFGATVSGGQRQRFAIARALLRETPIFLLDEATSQMDVRTEEHVLREVMLRLRGKTVVFVTHRLSAAAVADRVCVMEAGRLVGLGTHDLLLGTCQAYARLVAQPGDDQRPMPPFART